MRPFEARFDTIVWRYYLMMLIVIVPFVLGMPLLSLFALPMFLIAILGISFKNENRNEETKIKESKSRALYAANFDSPLEKAS